MKRKAVVKVKMTDEMIDIYLGMHRQRERVRREQEQFARDMQRFFAKRKEAERRKALEAQVAAMFPDHELEVSP